MGWFSDDSNEATAYAALTGNAPHKSEISHQLLAAAASYEAAKAYEKHVEKNGKPDSHAKAKEIIAALSGAAIDRIVETKGLDFVDKQKAKHHAKEKTEEALANSGEY